MLFFPLILVNLPSFYPFRTEVVKKIFSLLFPAWFVKIDILGYNCRMIDNFDSRKIKQFAEKHGLNLVVLFGSRARGEERKGSDTDIAVFAGKKKDVREISEMQIEFSETFHIKDIELVDISGKAPLFLKQVSDDGKVLYERKPGIFDEFQIYAFKRYVEAKPLFALRKQFTEDFIRSHATM
jgi:predicted nucleotidyltransferase